MKYRIIEGLESIQGSPEWLAFRKGKIGASDAASIVGWSPWETKLQCWERMMFDRSKAATPAMERGSRLEPIARRAVNYFSGIEFRPVVVQSIKHPDLIASLDGYSDEGTLQIIEIKCPNITTHEKSLRGEIPKHYLPQMYHQMSIIGLRAMTYISYFPDHPEKELVRIDCMLDEHVWKEMLAEELAFLKSMIECRPPEPSEQDWKVREDVEQILLAQRYEEVDRSIKIMEEQKDVIRSLLLKDMDHPRAKVGNLKIQKVLSKGRIDYEQLVKDYEIEDTVAYRKKATESWKITL